MVQMGGCGCDCDWILLGLGKNCSACLCDFYVFQFGVVRVEMITEFRVFIMS